MTVNRLCNTLAAQRVNPVTSDAVLGSERVESGLVACVME